jgi:Zn-finger protein
MIYCRYIRSREDNERFSADRDDTEFEICPFHPVENCQVTTDADIGSDCPKCRIESSAESAKRNIPSV